MAGFVERNIAAQGLCLSDFMVLEVLLHKGPLTMTEIGEKVLLANASMTSAIDRLAALGLVLRKNDDKDRRVRIVDLTREGRKRITALYGQHERDIEALMVDLSQAERNQLRNGLKKIGYAAQAARFSGQS
jgi:MarR family 2-MHQ and catechol resistance regulon transcriptional repressor